MSFICWECTWLAGWPLFRRPAEKEEKNGTNLFKLGFNPIQTLSKYLQHIDVNYQAILGNQLYRCGFIDNTLILLFLFVTRWNIRVLCSIGIKWNSLVLSEKKWTKYEMWYISCCDQIRNDLKAVICLTLINGLKNPSHSKIQIIPLYRRDSNFQVNHQNR